MTYHARGLPSRAWFIHSRPLELCRKFIEPIMTDQPPSSFTGRRGQRQTRPIVRISNVTAQWVITMGGIGTIVAVLGVLAFLVYVTAPLFWPGSVGNETYLSLNDSGGKSGTPVAMGVDEYLTTGWMMDQSGLIRVIDLDNGHRITTKSLYPVDESVTFQRYSPLDGSIVVGLDNGQVRIGSISFRTVFLDNDKIPDSARNLESGQVIADSGGTIERTIQGAYRRQDIIVDPGEAFPSGIKEPIHLADAITTDRGPIFAVMGESGELHINSTRTVHNMLTGEETHKVTSGLIPYQTPADHALPNYLFMSGLGDNLFLIWEDGRFQRYSTRRIKQSQLVEEGNFLAGIKDSSGQPAHLTAASLLTGRRTILIGDSGGGFSAWFRTKQEQADTPDGITMQEGHELRKESSPVTTITPSPRARIVIVGHENGSMRTVDVTSDKTLADISLSDGQPIRAAVVAPKENALFAFDGDSIFRCSFNPGYPEASFHAFFLPVWYEEAPKPALVWQSSSGTDDFEMKLSMIPLIVGTLKATFYSMIFAVPLALLAAVYTSEFMKPRQRAAVKPVVEVMASLPSVVLGYFAAIIFAPFIENVLPFALCSFVSVPVSFLFGAYLVQLLPYQINLRLTRYRLLLMSISLPLGFVTAFYAGPMIENWLFAGNIRIWLSGQIGTATGGWVLILFPLVAFCVAFFSSRIINPIFRSRLMSSGRNICAAADLVKFIILLLLTIGSVLGISYLLTAIGFDPRGSLMGTFVQRNAFVVGIVMGFAVIPIIYTIADDALSAVPSHLRAAALGAGATPWQTAITVIVPTAMSGLFSACMIGLGRAVGETMIVLMAAGNTPILDFNIFNGFRTLAANIAVEIPEAVRNSTHYRTLFFAALILFVMTFIVNTIAEIIRLRFRKRAFEL